MTREEAIKILKELPNSILGVILPFDTDFDYTQALNMAIKALELEPCCNCIMFKRYAKQMGFEMEQEPKSEWERDHEILKAYSNGANEVLDKIRAEIQAIIGERNLDDYDFCSGLIVARKIIDKYKTESEPQGSEKE